MASRNCLLGLFLLFSLFSCGEPEPRGPVVVLNLQSQQGSPLPIDEILALVNGGEGEAFFDLEGEFVVPLASSGEILRFGLEFPEDREGQEFALEIFGLREGIDVLSGEISLVVEDGAFFNVFIQFCGNQTEDSSRGEACDDGNLIDGDGCSADCTVEESECGNGIVESGEACDNGAENSDTNPDACRTGCSLFRCSDGVTDSGEECDDGNNADADGCEANCSLPACENGIADPGEVCYGQPVLLASDMLLEQLELRDFDGDSDMDFITAVFVNDIPFFLVKENDGAGQFSGQTLFLSDPRGTAPASIKSSDLDNDGDIDFLMGSLGEGFTPGSVAVTINNGAVQQPTQNQIGLPSSNELATLDLNGDGLLDIVTLMSQFNLIGLIRNLGAGSFDSILDLSAGGTPVAVSFGDLDDDGDTDIAVANLGSSNVSVFKNLGNFQFSTQTQFAVDNDPTSIAMEDLDNDGDLDIITASPAANRVSVLRNNGNGGFAPRISLVTGAEPVDFILEDLDNDGDLDIATANQSSNNLSVLLNNGNGTFAPQDLFLVGSQPSKIRVEDIDGDGFSDLITANTLSDDVSILLNQGQGDFLNQVRVVVGDGPLFLVLNDVNGDFVPDIVTGTIGAGTLSRTARVILSTP